MKPKFSPNHPLPDYLEEALAPFSVSGVFSKDFRTAFIYVIFASNECRERLANELVEAISVMDFLCPLWRDRVCKALTRFGKEGWGKK